MITPPYPVDCRPRPVRAKNELVPAMLRRVRSRALGRLIAPAYYFSLGPVSWAYLRGWINSEQWAWLNEHALWPIEDVMRAPGPLSSLLWAWQLWWER